MGIAGTITRIQSPMHPGAPVSCPKGPEGIAVHRNQPAAKILRTETLRPES